ncbi:helix-turn-helix domain-containing protein [Dactylosporangium matsuzakiense]|uniref:HTH cro/C1-type domain-containing protein n=1 Tax=Dactylosporangium matsuzakiense TaxID=53360 RepID=A0A9W6KP49_9ACTN|nr:helix-turn-helix transcriptional regulator [Dactylosporangium matsuzakiense]UWZ44679.1 helix-turn-helix transcriptional regulator [Dactylosporangium matsuzakiense]GLL04702.1 hypothetical protein GCM10017581_064490 [Dactylosporangium matsuzakiense]
MEIDEWPIGHRIAQHRMRRGLTQEKLAGLAGISLSMMKKIESGARNATRFAQLVLFAQVLRAVGLRDLTGADVESNQPRHPHSRQRRPRPDGRRGHTAVDGALWPAPPFLAECEVAGANGCPVAAMKLDRWRPVI